MVKHVLKLQQSSLRTQSNENNTKLINLPHALTIHLELFQRLVWAVKLGQIRYQTVTKIVHGFVCIDCI